MNKTQLIQQIYSGVRAVAIARSRSRTQMEDFLQDGILGVLEVIDKYTDRPYNEMVLIASRTAYNRITDAQKREINWSRKNLSPTKETNTEDTFTEEKPYDPGDRGEYDHDISLVEEKQWLSVLSSRLNSVERSVLRERVSPSQNTVDVMQQEVTVKMGRKEKGELVMGLSTPTVNDTHISISLGISKSTMCRVVKNIQNVAQELNDYS